MSGSEADRQRLDVWLWRARFFKSRALAASEIAAGGVRMLRGGASRIAAKPADKVQAADALTFRQGALWRTVLVLALPPRRGPAAEARTCYRDLRPDDPGDSLDAAEGCRQSQPASDPKRPEE